MSDFTDAIKGLPPDVAAQFSEVHDTPMARRVQADSSYFKGNQTFAHDPTEGMSPLQRGLAGVGQGMTDVVRKGGNLLGMQSNQDLSDAAQRDAPLLNTTAGNAGQFFGQTAATAPIGMGIGGLLSKAGLMAGSTPGVIPSLGRMAASPIAQGAAQGATQGAILGDPGQKGQGALLGAGLGSVLPTIGTAVNKMANGVTRTPSAQALIDAGVSLTPGQMNPTGIWNHAEQTAEGIPVIGGMVQNAREGAMKSYTRAKVADAMAPGAQLPAGGDFNQMIDSAARSYDPAYDVAKGFPVGAQIVNTQGPNVPLSKAFAQVAAQPRLGLDVATRQNLAGQLNDQTKEMIAAAVKSGKGLQSDDLLGLRSIIRTAARDESGETAASRATRDFWNAAESKVTQAIDSQLPAAASQGLKATDAQFAKFAIMRNVAKNVKDAPGGPTPFQISNAIAQSTDANSYARGGGLGRDLSKAARDTFQSNVPRTGLAGAGALGAGLLGKAAFGVAPMATGVAASPLAAMAGLTLTKTGRSLAAGNTGLQKMLQGGISNVQGAIPARLRTLLPYYGRSALVNGGLLATQ